MRELRTPPCRHAIRDAGTGCLTDELLKREGVRIIAVEADPRLCRLLQKKYEEVFYPTLISMHLLSNQTPIFSANLSSPPSAHLSPSEVSNVMLVCDIDVIVLGGVGPKASKLRFSLYGAQVWQNA